MPQLHVHLAFQLSYHPDILCIDQVTYPPSLDPLPLRPLMANAFPCSPEENLEKEDKLPNLYRRYVDDTITAMPDVHEAKAVLTTLKNYRYTFSNLESKEWKSFGYCSF